MVAIAVLPELIEQATQPTASGTAAPAEQATQQTAETSRHSAAQSSAPTEHAAQTAALATQHAAEVTSQRATRRAGAMVLERLGRQNHHERLGDWRRCSAGHRCSNLKTA
jgi:hypothetical protein